MAHLGIFLYLNSQLGFQLRPYSVNSTTWTSKFAIVEIFLSGWCMFCFTYFFLYWISFFINYISHWGEFLSGQIRRNEAFLKLSKDDVNLEIRNFRFWPHQQSIHKSLGSYNRVKPKVPQWATTATSYGLARIAITSILAWGHNHSLFTRN